MKPRFGIKLISLLFAVTFISSMVGYIVGARNTRAKATEQNVSENHASIGRYTDNKIPSHQKESDTVHTNDITQSYVLRENNGAVCLYSKFSDGRQQLYQSYDILVSLLPKSDRELLKKGIETDSLSDALQLVEDYSS